MDLVGGIFGGGPDAQIYAQSWGFPLEEVRVPVRLWHGKQDRAFAVRLAEEIAARLPGLRVLHHERNLGIWATFEHLYAEAGNELVFLNSTDGQWDTAILFDMLPLTSQWDVIIATRLNKHYGFGRRFISWGFNLVPRIIFGVKTFDAGSVKLVRREIIEQFALVSRSVFSEAERLIRAARAGYRITTFPVQTSGRRSSAAR